MINNELWPNLWRQYLDQYLSKPPRTGFWVDAHFGGKANSFLELGCGSGRDAMYLAQRGHSVVGSDLDDVTLMELETRFGSETLNFSVQDASNLTFDTDSFDVVYHNGLWVLFEDDDVIISMLKEQIRVASKYAIILVHNQENLALRRQFQKRADGGDQLYDIRFFNRTSLTDLIESSGLEYRSLKLMKFGGRFDAFYRKTPIKRVIPNVLWPLRKQLVPHLYQAESWTRTERLACVLEL
ncbi:MAG: class I SAM-dependent methyltransferase [Myxococcota bacterium]|nr:class I SAM-dependent methyltransferase [Myxococcota bacterium]